MVSQSLAVAPGGPISLGAQAEKLEGAEGFTQADLKIPVLKIVQGTSRMADAEAHIGQFYNSVTQEFTPGVNVVILSWKHTRSLFAKPGQGDTGKPVCQARDGVTGTTYGACRLCKYNAEVHRELWEPQNRDALRCALGYSLLLVFPDDGLPAMFTAAKTNVNAIKIINTILTAKRSALFAATWTFTTVRKVDQAAGRKWFELVARVAKWNTQVEIEYYRGLSNNLRSSSIETVDDEADAAPVAAGETIDGDPGPSDQDAPF